MLEILGSCTFNLNSYDQNVKTATLHRILMVLNSECTPSTLFGYTADANYRKFMSSLHVMDCRYMDTAVFNVIFV